jgi:hypothetical protein
MIQDGRMELCASRMSEVTAVFLLHLRQPPRKLVLSGDLPLWSAVTSITIAASL